MSKKPDPTKAALVTAVSMLTLVAIMDDAPAAATVLFATVLLALVTPERQWHKTKHRTRKQPRAAALERREGTPEDAPLDE